MASADVLASGCEVDVDMDEEIVLDKAPGTTKEVTELVVAKKLKMVHKIRFMAFGLD